MRAGRKFFEAREGVLRMNFEGMSMEMKAELD